MEEHGEDVFLSLQHAISQRPRASVELFLNIYTIPVPSTAVGSTSLHLRHSFHSHQVDSSLY